MNGAPQLGGVDCRNGCLITALVMGIKQLTSGERTCIFTLHLIIQKDMSYCSAIKSMTGERKELHKAYHDTLYGFPIHDDNELFGRMVWRSIKPD